MIRRILLLPFLAYFAGAVFIASVVAVMATSVFAFISWMVELLKRGREPKNRQETLHCKAYEREPLIKKLKRDPASLFKGPPR